MKLTCQTKTILAGLLILLIALIANTSRACVYATDIRLNGSLGPAWVITPSNSVTISYILNQTADNGVEVDILSGTNIVKTFSSTNNAAGTNTGYNAIVWDGTWNSSTNFVEDVYNIRITAGANGFYNWTNLTDDSSNFSVAVPRGIAVNQNSNSLYYGRVFVSSTYTEFGIRKYNADGSAAEEGEFSSGGLSWGANTGAPKFSPWKIAVSADDYVYIDDFSSGGILYQFDQTIADYHYRVAIDTSNYPLGESDPELGGVAVTGSGTNTQIWMSEGPRAPDEGNSLGIVVWNAATNGVADPNDMGTVAVPLETNFMTSAPYDVALDANGRIYTIQYNRYGETPGYALMRFAPFTNGPVTQPDWAVAMYPDLVDVYGVAVDPSARWVAVAVAGTGGEDPEFDDTGGVYLFCASNGNYITNLDSANGHAYYDVAWDNVGNLYALDGTAQVWRAYSPPGTNQSTTCAAPFVQAYNAVLPPTLVDPQMVTNRFNFTLQGQSNVTYVIQSSCNLTNWTTVKTNYSAMTNRSITLHDWKPQNFYRAVALP